MLLCRPELQGSDRGFCTQSLGGIAGGLCAWVALVKRHTAAGLLVMVFFII